MKRLISLLIAGLSVTAIFGQNKTQTLEHTLSIGTFGYSCTYNLLFPVYESFNLGGGVGLGLSYPTNSKSVWYKEGVIVKSSKEHLIEAGIPVYLRANYQFDRYYVNLDLGYNVGFLTVHPTLRPGSAIFASQLSYSGFFAEPQFGFRLNDKYSIAVGTLLHQGHGLERTVIVADDSTEEQVVYKSKLFPSLTIRFARHF